MTEPTKFTVNGLPAKEFSAFAAGNGPATLYADGQVVEPAAWIGIRADVLAAALCAYQKAGFEADGVAQRKKAAITLAAGLAAIAKAQG